MIEFNPHNPRVKLARRKKIFHRPIFIFLSIALILTLIIGGGVLLFLHYSFGWIFIGFSSLPFMFLFWIQNALQSVPIKESQDFTDLLAEELLLRLKPTTTPHDLVKIIPDTPSGLFLMARYEFSLEFLTFLDPLLSDTTGQIYQSAINIRTQTNSDSITAAILLVAIIESLPEYQQLLNRLKLSSADLYQGVEWYNYLHSVAEESKKPIRSGGIARDLAFGFTPTLQRYAVNLSANALGSSHKIQQAENTDIINKMVSTFTHDGRQNIALIGHYGSGRSTIVRSFAEKLLDADSDVPRSLKFRQLYSLDAPSLIASASTPSELEYLLINIFNEIYSAKNIILCLDNAHLFFEEGPGSVDISNFLTPIIEAGTIRIIMIMDDQKFLEISDKNPALANSLNKIIVHPSDRPETIRILMDQIPYLEHQKNVIYTYQSLIAAYDLSEQYIHDVEMPGRAKLLLETAATYANHGLVTPDAVQSAIEQSYGVKVKIATEGEDRDKLLNLETLIHQQMIDQEEAVSAVSNALRRAGAGIKNQKRPIGTFLFLGPTGVGKTELAKAISRVYFNGEDQIIRLDMNEFVSANDVARLIQDGATDALSLASQVMKHPFSVVLLDEIEKAHPSVLTTLLQVLDEGILRDEKNREISFRDTIIIATSNAGANEIREQISSGASLHGFKEKLTDMLVSSGEFKPEFLNRFDEICLFKPLSKEDLLQVLDLIIASTNHTLEPQKISVEVTDEAKKLLIEHGYDPKMGARPMRRIVQKTVENIVAASILSGAANSGSHLVITPEEINAVI